MDKLYITHYYYPGTDPWKNIMLLPEEEAFSKAKELADLHPGTTSFGRFADFENYYPARKKADAFVRERFIELGGNPKLEHPYSFTLRECEYLREWFSSTDKIIIDLEDIPEEQVSFTLGDSCALIVHGKEPVVLTKKMLLERIEACNGSTEVFFKEALGKYAYVEVQLWDRIQEGRLKCKSSNSRQKILLFDLFETLLEDVSIDFNLGLRSIWEEHYKDKCSFDDIKAYGEELFVHMQNLHNQGLEFPFVKDELPLYAEKYGGDVIDMNIDEEAEFLSECNEVRVYDGLYEMLDFFAKEGIPMFVLSNSGFRAGALEKLLDSQGIGRFFEKVWSSADFGKVKPAADFFEMAVGEILGRYPGRMREDILFIGDTYKTDIVGAHNAGLKAIWINRKNEPDRNGFADYQIKDVTELWSSHIV